MSPESKGAGGLHPIDHALQGRLADVSLFDVCQFLMLNRKTGTLTARRGGRSAFLTFDQGQLLNAVDETLRDGEAVILSAVQWDEGTFSFDAGPVAPDRRIHSSTENILLEAARQLDEMGAGDLLEREEGEDAPVSHVDRFQEKQRKSAELSEAFRRAVASDSETSLGAAWKEMLVEALVGHQAERILVGPGAGIYLVGGESANPVEVPSFGEVEQWLASIADPGPSWDPRRGAAHGAWGRGPNDTRLWVTKHSSAEGAWFTVCHPGQRFPSWEGMGFDGDTVDRLRARVAGPRLLASGDERVLGATVAAWLTRRSSESPGVVWVIEPTPSYDWSVLPGRIRTISEREVADAGGLAELCDRSQPAMLVLRSTTDAELVRAAWAAAVPGREVLLAVQCPDGGDVFARLPAHDQAAFDPTTAAFVWWVLPGSESEPYPVVSRFESPDPGAARAA